MIRFLCLLLLWACAKVGPPAGGPVDQAPPAVVAHTPAADAVEVPLDAPVELLFSEAMDRSRTQAALFLSPLSPIEPGWQGRRLRLRFPQGLQPGQTYVITLGTGARDLRGNPLPQSFTLAFATGPRLDQGRIGGRVFSRHQPAGGTHVLAYGLNRGQRRLLADPPDYRTQAGNDGGYAFSRLPAGPYRLVAFADADADQTWDPGEALALPSLDLDLGDADSLRASDLDLFAAPGPPRLERVQALDQQRLLFLFGQEVDPAQVLLEIAGLPVEFLYQLPPDRRKLYARTAPQEAGRAYPLGRLEIAGQSPEWGEPVRGVGRPDQTPPALAATRPAAGGILAPQDTLLLIFSEAMVQAELGEVWVADDSAQTPAGRWSWQGPAVLAFAPQAPWTPGTYQLRGRTAGLRDLAGLGLRDSLFALSFTAAPLDCRLGGQVRPPARAPVWVGALGPEQNYQVQADPEGHFLFADLPPGAYRVYAFADLNLNQQQDRGTLEPFAPAEPYTCLPEALTLAAGAAREDLELELDAP